MCSWAIFMKCKEEKKKDLNDQRDMWGHLYFVFRAIAMKKKKEEISLDFSTPFHIQYEPGGVCVRVYEWRRNPCSNTIDSFRLILKKKKNLLSFFFWRNNQGLTNPFFFLLLLHSFLMLSSFYCWTICLWCREVRAWISSGFVLDIKRKRWNRFLWCISLQFSS